MIASSVARSVARSVANAVSSIGSTGGSVAPWTDADEGDAVADAYFAAIVAEGGTISAPNQARVTALMVALAEADLLKQIKVLYLYHGNTLDSAAINAVNPGGQPGSYPIVWTGTPTLDADGGFTASASAYGVPVLHIDSVFSYQTGLSLGFWGASTPGGADYPIGYGTVYHSPNTGYTRIAGAFKGDGSPQDPLQFHVGTREPNSDIIRAYRNTTRWVDATEAWPEADLYTSPLEAGSIGIGRLKGYGGEEYDSVMKQSLTFVGRGLLAAQITDLSAAFAEYMA